MEPMDCDEPDTLSTGVKRKRDDSEIAEEPRKKPKTDEFDSTDDNLPQENVYIPDEILLAILKLLPRSNLSSAMLVSHQWHDVSKDKCFRWYLVSSVHCYECPTEYNKEQMPKEYNHIAGESWDVRREKSQKIQKFQEKARQEFHKNAPQPELLGRNCTLVGRDGTLSRYISHPGYETCLVADHPDIWRADIKTLHGFGGQHDYQITLSVNLAELECHLYNGGSYFRSWKPLQEPILNDTKKLFEKKMSKLLSGVDYKAVFPSDVPSECIEVPKDLKLTLYKYQLKAVSWAVSYEDRVKEGLEITYNSLVPWDTVNSSILADFIGTKIVPSQEIDEYNQTIPIYGGMLADEMGLGKTIEMLAVILARPYGKLDEKEPCVSVIEGEDDFIVTKATLILCPSHLCKQWADELQEHSDIELNIITCTTITQLKKLNYRDIANADIVIIPHGIIKNKKYKSKRSQKRSAITKLKKSNFMDSKNPNLFAFNWHRLILDEGHEIISDLDSQRGLACIHAAMKWYVTGTPFPNLEKLIGACWFVYGKSSDPHFSWHWREEKMKGKRYVRVFYPSGGKEREQHKIYNVWVLADLFLKNFLWKNTKLSVAKEFDIPPFVEKVELIDFHNIERINYAFTRFKSKADKAVLFKICAMQTTTCDHSADNLEIRRVKLITDAKAHLASMKSKLVNDKQSMPAIRLLIDNHENNSAPLFVGQYESKKSEFIRKTRSVAFLTKSIPTFEAFIENKIDTLKEVSTECIEKKQHQLGTRESTTYDVDTIKKELSFRLAKFTNEEESKSLLMSKLEHEDYCIKSKNFPEVGFNNLTLDEAVIIYGTKLGHLLNYTKNLLTNEPKPRIILFSKYAQVLKQVSHLLFENGIHSISVMGTAKQKDASIEQFRNGEKNILLLSSENAASGTNLVEAEYVILVDPVSGSKSEAEATEGQAIGRAYRIGQEKQVIVVKFIVKHTVEHETYKMHQRGELVESTKKRISVIDLKDKLPANRRRRMWGSWRGKKLQRTGSIGTLLKNQPKLERTASSLLNMESSQDE